MTTNYGFPEHRSDPSIHILSEKRDGVTRELEKWNALIGSDTFCDVQRTRSIDTKMVFVVADTISHTILETSLMRM